MKHISVSILTCGLLTASILAAGSPHGAGRVAAASSWTGTIVMYAQDYTPNSKVENPDHLHALQDVATAYQKMHPGVTIQFVDEKYADSTQIVRAKAAAGQLWDVWYSQWANLNGGVLPHGIAVDLTPYFKQKNPYLPGVATWQQAMNQTVVNETMAPNGAHYNINGDFVGTAFFYNKDLFKKAGINEAPRSWQQLLADSQRLKAAGITAMVDTPLHGWWERHWLTDFYSRDFNRIAGWDGNPSAMSALDEAVDIYKGILTPKDPRFMAWWPIFKQFVAYWDPQYVAQDPSVTDEPTRQEFIAGRAAMYYSGSWTPNYLKAAHVTFSWGSFPFPTLDKSVSPYVTGINTSGQVGGPNAAYQFAISTQQADHSMSPAKFAAVLDWLRYIGTPKVIQPVVNEKGTYVPTWPGTKTAAGNTTFVFESNQPLRSVWVGNSSPQLDPTIQRTFGLYLSGNLSLSQAETQVQQAETAAMQSYQTTNNVNLAKYK